MDYDSVASTYLKAPEQPFEPVVLPTSPARRLRDALEPIATHGWWCRPTNERLARLGLGFLEGYVRGRAASLGDPAPSVVVAAFGVFEPSFLSTRYEEARRSSSRDDVLAARAEGVEQSLGSLLAGADVAPVADVLAAAVEGLDGAARPLFSGLRDLPWPTSPAGRLWRAAELVREHRGDGHLAACVAAGLDPVSMNVLTELWLGRPAGPYVASRGYDEAALAACLERLTRQGWVADGALTDEGRKFRQAIEDATDTSQAQLVAALGPRLDEVVGPLSEWSQRVVAAGAFPPDPFKRAAG